MKRLTVLILQHCWVKLALIAQYSSLLSFDRAFFSPNVAVQLLRTTMDCWLGSLLPIPTT